MSPITQLETEILDELRNVIAPTGVFVDGGGGHGDWTAEVLSRWPEAMVYLFEPHPMNFALCQERFRTVSNVHLVEAALSNKRESHEFWADGHIEDFGASLFKRGHHFRLPIQVKTAVLGDLHPTPVSFLKLDVEGGEFDALRGLGDLRPSYIQFEYGDTWRDAKTSIEDAYRLLKAMGYHIEEQAPAYYGFANILAVLK